jgi:hypothetical protein
MRASDIKNMLSKVVKYNLEQYERAMTGGNSKGVFNTYVVPFIQGPPGCGKISLPRQVAAQFEIPYSQTIIAQYDAGEMAGFPAVINREYPVLDDEGTHVGRKIVQRMGMCVYGAPVAQRGASVDEREAEKGSECGG